jgi:hypothetical protein
MRCEPKDRLSYFTLVPLFGCVLAFGLRFFANIPYLGITLLALTVVAFVLEQQFRTYERKARRRIRDFSSQADEMSSH